MWTAIKRPILALAPMTDMTDAPFCHICREVSGTDFVIFREMVSSEAIARGNIKTLRMCEFEGSERPLVLQIFGANPDVLVKAAQSIVERFKPDGLDINMGCPVPKIAGRSQAGAALIKNPVLAVQIISKLKKSGLAIPVSVKTRLGWGRAEEILSFAPRLEEAGADAIAIHGRTRAQGYSGKADWEMIGRVKQILSIPVIANGDISDADSVRRCLEITGADGVMIGRGALGRPWIFSDIRHQNTDIRIDKIIPIVLKHAKLHLKHYGAGAMVTFRKHLAYYFKSLDNVKDLRRSLMMIKTIEELERLLLPFL